MGLINDSVDEGVVTVGKGTRIDDARSIKGQRLG